MGTKDITLWEKTRKTIEQYKMIDDHEPIIVGVSGGPDSMALLDILLNIVDNELIVAHLNHQFRGTEAEKDAEFVRIEAEKRGIMSVISEYDVPKYIEQTKLSAQEAAREIRYDFYKRTAEKYKAKYIALGHHANDQAETILMRLLRGSGINGLAGIPPIRYLEEFKIIRPLLGLSREEIESYCEYNSISYRIDQSNLKTKYLRNDIRLQVIPYLEKYNPKLVSQLNNLGKILYDENNLLNDYANEKLAKSIIKKNTNTYIIRVSMMQNIDIALQRRMIHLILRYLNLKQDSTYAYIDSILDIVNHQHPSKSIDLPGAVVYRDYEKLVFTKLKITEKKPYTYSLAVPGEKVIEEADLIIRAFVSTKYQKCDGTYAIFDYDLLNKEALLIRSRKNGDRINSFGLDGTKKVKDIFIDKKVSREIRDIYPIIEAGNNIIWIPGLNRSNIAPVTNETKRFLYLIKEDL